MTAGERGARKFPLPLARLSGASSPAQGDARALLRPQRPLAVAHAEIAAAGSRSVGAAGTGLDSVEVRRRMVARLASAGIVDARVLAAFAAVPRHQFVDAALVVQAYEDTSLPIGLGQTISKPSVVARMLELLFAGANARRAGHLGRVLEIGTGCGYQAALLCEAARDVVSVERMKALHEKARTLLAPLRSSRLRLVYGDGRHGHPPNAPYDAIVAAAGGEAVPDAWLQQLAIGGRLVAPVEQPGGGQALVVVDRDEAGWRRSTHEAVKFVPLKSGLAGR